jgi:hypothetical protein
VSVDELRKQLKDRGYLTHGIERWFALDPWSSRAFWLELVMVALKAATLIAAFGALPMTAVMLFRNAPLGALETLALFVSYAAVWLVAAFVFVVAIALLLKVRPALAIDTPAALLAISFAAAAVLVAPIVLWWSGFDTRPAPGELAIGVTLTVVFFLVVTIVTSAALLSFSIYELKRIPAIHQKPRGVPMIVAAIVLIAMLFVPAYADRQRTEIEPMVVTTPTTSRIALVAVDGLTYEIFRSRPDLHYALPLVAPVHPIAGDSAPARWASLGTGVRAETHGVRGVEGVRFRGGGHLLQRISRADVVLLDAAPLLGIARREALPPTVRRREYVWEILAERGVPSLSLNWWTTGDASAGALQSIGPESIFSADPLRIDGTASARLLALLDQRKPRFATVYLPALDVVLNRLALDPSTKLARSLQALDALTKTIAAVRAGGYEVVLVGLPGENQTGRAIIASTLPLRKPIRAWDVAPTLLDLFGFPLSDEMPGRSLAGTPEQPRIASYGARAAGAVPARVNDEYYENLKSLGYIR